MNREKPSSPKLSVLINITLTRLLINTAIRMIYPFLPEIARHLDSDLAAVSRLSSLRSLGGLLSPLFSPFSERAGRKPLVLLGMSFLCLAGLIFFLFPRFWSLGIFFILVGLAKAVFDPSLQSYLGDSIPYQQRGLPVAITEIAWSGSLLIGAPLMGYLIPTCGWTSPFLLFFILGLPAFALLWKIIPSYLPLPLEAKESEKGGRRSGIWLALIFALLALMANELVLIVFGGFMESKFSLSLTSLGLVSAVIGCAELSGEITAGLFADRWGKKRVVLLSALLATIMYLVCPFLSSTLHGALIGLFLLFFLFETMIVAAIPLFSELSSKRSLALSLFTASESMGRALGAIVGPTIYLHWGFTASGITASLIMVPALLSFWKVKEVQGE